MKYDIAINVEIFGDCRHIAHDSLITDSIASCFIDLIDFMDDIVIRASL